jgi:hypothetical protein
MTLMLHLGVSNIILLFKLGAAWYDKEASRRPQRGNPWTAVL